MKSSQVHKIPDFENQTVDTSQKSPFFEHNLRIRKQIQKLISFLAFLQFAFDVAFHAEDGTAIYQILTEEIEHT